jgi:hypothetical protein
MVEWSKDHVAAIGSLNSIQLIGKAGECVRG